MNPMILGTKKVIAFTPAGRKRYLEILLPYVIRDQKKGLIDEWVLFNNAYQNSDEDYIHSLAIEHPWITVYEEAGHRDAFHIHSYFKQFTDPDATYVRLDDDIVYIAPNAIWNLVAMTEQDSNKKFLNYPVIVGNSRSMYWMQQAGKIPAEWGLLTDEILTHHAYEDPAFVAKVHQLTLEKIREGTVEEYFSIPNEILDTETMKQGQTSPSGHMSVNCFGIRGEDMMALKDKIVPDEERFLSLYQPAELGRDNLLVGSAFVVHFAYHTMTQALEDMGLLADYKQIADSL